MDGAGAGESLGLGLCRSERPLLVSVGICGFCCVGDERNVALKNNQF